MILPSEVNFTRLKIFVKFNSFLIFYLEGPASSSLFSFKTGSFAGFVAAAALELAAPARVPARDEAVVSVFVLSVDASLLSVAGFAPTVRFTGATDRRFAFATDFRAANILEVVFDRCVGRM